ncbi:MAG TPA: bifunctional lysylphosphatidylglycerol flippase/synthetase MprF [Longimicrobium sp.]|nr:bifunctional lysylphosphatidylglycerol flippase/synthetase MprF [Longimicrobium sp.]
MHPTEAAPPPPPPHAPPALRAAAAAWRWLSPAIGVALFAAGIWVIRSEMERVSYPEIRRTLAALPASALLLSVLFTIGNYTVLTAFDLLAFRYVGRKVRAWKVAVASFTGYAISNSVGWALVSGTSVRYRFYSRWDIPAGEISRIVLFYSGTFWLGLLVLGGLGLTFDPHPGLRDLVGGPLVRATGVALLATALAYAAFVLFRRRPVRFRGFEVPPPSPGTMAAQFALSTVDWAMAAAGLYVLLPRTDLSYAELLSAFMAAQLIGLVSHVPGGVGVFEGTMAILLRGHLSTEALISSLVVYRLVYYILPLGAALAVLVADEVRLRRHLLARWGGAFGALTGQLAPKVLAAFTFLAGVVLLFSGATPTEGARLRLVAENLPLALVEGSYFIGSVAGVALLLVSNGVARRLDFAWQLAMATLAVGIGASLLKGADYEEALFLGALLVAMALSRQEFDRRAAFWETRFSLPWTVAVVAVVGASVWLGLFAFRHVEYSSDLWWRFAANQDAPRALRGSVGAMVAVLAFGVARLLRPAPPEIAPPTDAELEEAGRLIARQPSTAPYLVYLRDKALLFTPARDAFLMYGVQGRSWIAMGEPVGDPRAATGLIRQFLGRCDDFGGVPVFYQVPGGRLHQYADFGLTFAKLGEEAFVSLADFHTDGADRKPFRLVLNRFERAELRFRVLEPAEVPGALAAAREVSDAWLASRGKGEKGFSLGFFDPEYMRRFPLAVVESGRGMEAFATVWPGPDGAELSVDLMRYRGDAPKNVMEALLLHLMLWGKARGYARFGLGMAPLSGLEMSAVAPAWTRVGTWLFESGDATFYNFQGLRLYKEKFHPVWEPRYLAWPGGMNLPRITADVSLLVGRGYRRILTRSGK